MKQLYVRNDMEDPEDEQAMEEWNVKPNECKYVLVNSEGELWCQILENVGEGIWCTEDRRTYHQFIDTRVWSWACGLEGHFYRFDIPSRDGLSSQLSDQQLQQCARRWHNEFAQLGLIEETNPDIAEDDLLEGMSILSRS